jgi:hypothetical protein
MRPICTVEAPDAHACLLLLSVVQVIQILHNQNIVKRRPKSGIVKPEEASIARQRLGKLIPSATNK